MGINQICSLVIISQSVKSFKYLANLAKYVLIADTLTGNVVKYARASKSNYAAHKMDLTCNHPSNSTLFILMSVWKTNLTEPNFADIGNQVNCEGALEIAPTCHMWI